MRLSVVIPCYNERAHVLDILAVVEAQASVSEIVLVDDGSTDGTRDVLRDLERRRAAAPGPKPLVLLFRERNEGKGAAVRAGLAAVTGDVTIIQDADLEYDPADYAKLLAEVEKGAPAVFGSRYLHGHRDAAWHLVGNKSLTWFSNLLTFRHLTDMETCYKMLRTPLFRSLPLRERGFGLEPEIAGLLCRKGVPIRELPISYRPRSYAEGKKIGWRDAFKTTYVILRTALSR